MARQGYTERQRIDINGIVIVLGYTDRTTNPKYQYPAHLERWYEDILVSLPIQTSYGWSCPELQDTSKEGTPWDTAKVIAYWEDNLHTARTKAVKVGSSGVIRRKGVMPACPQVQERIAFLNQQKAEQFAASQAVYEAANSAQAEKNTSLKERARDLLKTDLELPGFSRSSPKKKILSFTGRGDDDIVTLQVEGQEETSTIEVKWLLSTLEGML